MIERMQRHVTDCCGTAVIYKKPSWERFDVTMPPSSFGLTPSAILFGHTRSIPRDFRQRVVNFPNIRNGAGWVSNVGPLD